MSTPQTPVTSGFLIMLAGFLGVILVAIAMFIIAFAFEPTADDTPTGDVTCNGAVTADDALQLQRQIAGLDNYARCAPSYGDVDCDGDTDAVDVLKIQRYLAGLSYSQTEPCTDLGVYVPPLGVRDSIRAAAINYWYNEDGEAALLALQPVTVYDQLSYPYNCIGWGGCAPVEGCTTYAPDFCFIQAFGPGYDYWGGDWYLGMLKHEMGHALGYNHGDPTCTMNPDYCDSPGEAAMSSRILQFKQ